MRALKFIGISLVPAVLIFGIFWLGGWDFERGPWTAYMGFMSVSGGVMAASLARSQS